MSLPRFNLARLRLIRFRPDLVHVAGLIRHATRNLLPPPMPRAMSVGGRAALGAMIGICLSGLLTRLAAHGLFGPQLGSHLWLMAPLGASSVLLFAVPASPFSYPWAVIIGNLVSALMAMACVFLIKDPAIASGVAVALSIFAMFALRAVHPPGGGVAVMVALAGIEDPTFLIVPLLVNSVLLVLSGAAYNYLADRYFSD